MKLTLNFILLLLITLNINAQDMEMNKPIHFYKSNPKTKTVQEKFLSHPKFTNEFNIQKIVDIETRKNNSINYFGWNNDKLSSKSSYQIYVFFETNEGAKIKQHFDLYNYKDPRDAQYKTTDYFAHFEENKEKREVFNGKVYENNSTTHYNSLGYIEKIEFDTYLSLGSRDEKKVIALYPGKSLDEKPNDVTLLRQDGSICGKGESIIKNEYGEYDPNGLWYILMDDKSNLWLFYKYKKILTENNILLENENIFIATTYIEERETKDLEFYYKDNNQILGKYNGDEIFYKNGQLCLVGEREKITNKNGETEQIIVWYKLYDENGILISSKNK